MEEYSEKTIKKNIGSMMLAVIIPPCFIAFDRYFYLLFFISWIVAYAVLLSLPVVRFLLKKEKWPRDFLIYVVPVAYAACLGAVWVKPIAGYILANLVQWVLMGILWGCQKDYMRIHYPKEQHQEKDS